MACFYAAVAAREFVKSAASRLDPPPCCSQLRLVVARGRGASACTYSRGVPLRFATPWRSSSAWRRHTSRLMGVRGAVWRWGSHNTMFDCNCLARIQGRQSVASSSLRSSSGTCGAAFPASALPASAARLVATSYSSHLPERITMPVREELFTPCQQSVSREPSSRASAGTLMWVPSSL